MKPRELIKATRTVAVWFLGISAAAGIDLQGLAEKSNAAIAADKWQEALNLTSEAVARFGQDDPLKSFGSQFGTIYYRKGVCEMKLKRWADAMQSFEICYRDFPNEGADRGNLYQKMALLKWGEAAMGAENWQLAVERFTKFTDERDKKRDVYPQGAFYINTAICQFKLGRLPEGCENLEIAVRNKENFPTPESGIVAGFQALVEAAIAKADEQALLDFIGKNRGELILGPAETKPFTDVFLKLAGDALASGMQRAALAVYQFIPCTEADAPETIKLSALALIHEKNGNIRGAFAAYQQLARYFPKAAGREDHLYHLVRTASLIDEADAARNNAGLLLKEFPQSAHLAEIRAAGIDFPATVSEPPPLKELKSQPAGKANPKTPAFIAAVDLYQGRKYSEAMEAFREIRKRLKSKDDVSVLAGFYETECLRKSGDLDGLAKAVQALEKRPSLGVKRLRQLEIDALWEAVRTESWDRVEAVAKARGGEKLPGDQRAQVAFCEGTALENLGRPLEALDAYNVAMTADAGASEEIARNAALGVLRILKADPEVGQDENQSDRSLAKRKEAAGVATLFELSLGAGMPLPAEFREFLKDQAKSAKGN